MWKPVAVPGIDRAPPGRGRLRRWVQVKAPLTPSRFFGNRIDSFANTRLGIPSDPERAHHELCGNDASAVPGAIALSTRPPPMGSSATPAPLEARS
jgi:hypothetical protein